MTIALGLIGVGSIGATPLEGGSGSPGLGFIDSAQRTFATVCPMASGIYASMRYADASAAIEWLEDAFGFERKAVHEGESGQIDHAELRYGDGLVMLGSERPGDEQRKAGCGWAYVVVEDVDDHCASAKAAGAEIVEEPMHQDYGSFYLARDPEGNLWSFGTYDPAG